MDKKQQFGLRLQSLRRARGLSQESLAERIDRSKDAVSKMERGVNLPAFDTILRLAECLGVSAADFFKDYSEPDQDPEIIDLQARLEGGEVLLGRGLFSVNITK